MYLLYCAIAFYFLANFSKNKTEWFVLSVLSLSLWCNKEYFNATDDALYYVRAFLTFFAAYILLVRMNKFAFYQSFILFLLLFCYAVLAYDVSSNSYNIIYDNYEGFVHGLVCCQFIASIPELFSILRDIYTTRCASGGYNKRL